MAKTKTTCKSVPRKSLATAKRQPADHDDNDWKQNTIKFVYDDKKYKVVPYKFLVLQDMSPTEIREYLNEVPARYAYWKAFQVHVERELADLKDEYEIWFIKKLLAVDDEIGKAKSDTLKKNMVVLDNVKEYREWQRKIRDLEDTSKKVGVITTGFNTLTWTLQSIAKLTCAEMSNIEAHGKSSLADIRK